MSAKTLATRGIAGSAVLLAIFTGLRRFLSRALLRKLLGLSPEIWPVDEWLLKVREEAIDPDRQIIDPHIHLWDARVQPRWGLPLWHVQMLYFFNNPAGVCKLTRDTYVKTGRESLLNSFGRTMLPFVQPYMANEFKHDVKNMGCGKRGHNIVKSVYIECGWEDRKLEECMQPVGEVQMVEAVNKECPDIGAAIIANANFLLPDVERTLAVLVARPLVRGVRHSLSWTADPEIEGNSPTMTLEGKAASDPRFRNGFALLQKYGLSYDCWLFHEQLGELASLARDFPNQVIICDHVAEPLGIGSYTREGTFDVWAKGITELAKASENVYVKLSGLGMLRTGFGFDIDHSSTPPTSKQLAEAWGPYFNHCIEAFGVKRAFFASNFPVDRQSCDYTVLWNAFKLIVENFSEDDKHQLFYGNAQRVYKLSTSDSKL